MQTPPILLSIVLATRDRPARLPDCLASLLDQKTDAPYEIIVVEEQSTALNEMQSPRIRHVRIATASRPAAKNLGAFMSLGRIVLFVHDDQLADGNLVSRHIAFHEQHADETAAAVGAQANLELSDVPLDPLTAGSFAANLSVKRSLFVVHGLLSQNLCPIEEIEWAHRMKRFGLQLLPLPQAIVRPNPAAPIVDDQTQRLAAMRAMSHLHRKDPRIQEYCRPILAAAPDGGP